MLKRGFAPTDQCRVPWGLFSFRVLCAGTCKFVAWSVAERDV